ncbi:MAG: hypothetical protein WCT51_01265 [Candidatus Shapirobacteria bacterium]|jgi:hypothetical protein
MLFKVIIVSIVLISVTSTLTPPAYALNNQCNTRYCVNTPSPCDLGGGKWDDQNYVLLASDYLNLKDPSPYVTKIYYKGERLYLNFHAKKDGNYIWGISTKWAYIHPGWKNNDNWEIRFK